MVLHTDPDNIKLERNTEPVNDTSDTLQLKIGERNNTVISCGYKITCSCIFDYFKPPRTCFLEIMREGFCCSF
ncbi:MAG: hypothetical protein QF734_00095 [Arenicellales bacterium]|nr:hypothetical protein [Arenicellales bacterium]